MKILVGKFRYWLFSALFAVSLTASILLGANAPSYSQATQSPTKQDLLKQVRELAQSDVEDDIPRRTQFAIDLYGENEVGLTAPEIQQAYDEEYTKQKTIKSSDLKELLHPENGLFFVIVGGVVSILLNQLKDTVSNWFSSLFTAIADWVYARYSGTQAFRGVALRRYRQALFDKYKDLHIPFRTNYPPLDMSEVYVPLKVSGGRDIEQIDAYEALAAHRRLMVKGPPGSGKSMLLKHIALTYGSERLVELPEWPVVVLLELYRVSDDELTEEKLIQALIEAFERNAFPNADRFVRQSLDNGTLMLLLDGLDEVNSAARSTVSRVIRDLLDRYEDCRAIITCRTAVYRDEFIDVTDQTLDVVELTDQQIRRFLHVWEREFPKEKSIDHPKEKSIDHPEEKSIDQLMELLRNRPQILALVKNPLLLTIVTHLYANPVFELPRSRAEFYQESTRILLDQREYKGPDAYKYNRYQTKDKRQVLQHLALYSQNHGSQQAQDRLGMAYTTVLEQIQHILPDLTLAEADTKPILDEIAETSGLFLAIDGGNRYQFAHRTLQEYFAASALVSNETELIQRFRRDPAAWREVVKLWCGLAPDNTALIQAVYAQDPITGFECLADAQKVDQTLANAIIQQQKQALATAPPNADSLVRAFGIVAGDSRGQEIFQYLKDISQRHS
ncbi:MAG: NACHT domain-containing protein [Leptolyngbyaceae cyanobacterium MO_188.B28]|nr:NACHT domain-containing protein [Leptolyngbyaceae cyanobacterium MO_188.B28]